MNLMNLATIGFFGFMGVLFVFVMIMFRNRVAQQAEQQRVADAMFEAEMMRNLGTAADSAFVPGTLSAGANEGTVSALADDAEIPSVGADTAAFTYKAAEVSPVLHPQVGTTQPVTDTGASGEDIHRQPADQACAAIVRQLQVAGMVDDQEGFLEINGNAKAAVLLRLKGGKRALVLPYFESEPFALRNLRRYDMLIYMGRNGKAVVVTALEELIASRVAGSMSGY